MASRAQRQEAFFFPSVPDFHHRRHHRGFVRIRFRHRRVPEHPAAENKRPSPKLLRPRHEKNRHASIRSRLCFSLTLSVSRRLFRVPVRDKPLHLVEARPRPGVFQHFFLIVNKRNAALVPQVPRKRDEKKAINVRGGPRDTIIEVPQANPTAS